MRQLAVNDIGRYQAKVICDQPSGGKFIEYGKLCLAYGSITYPLVNVSYGAANSNLDLYTNFSNYIDCWWEISVVDHSDNIVNVYPPQHFASTAALAAWVNTYLPNDGSYFTHTAIARVFDIEDPQIAAPAKLYGKNGILSRIRDRGRYYGHPRKSVTATNWPESQMDAMLREAWMLLFGPILPDPFSDNQRACFWVNSNTKTMYNCALSGLEIYLPVPGAGGRYGYNTDTSTESPADGRWELTTRHVTGGEPVYLHVAANGTFVEAFGADSVHNHIPIVLGSGGSIMIAIPLEQNGTTNTQAVLLKPLGIDQLYPSYFDATLYELEAVGGRKIDGTLRIRKMGDPRVGASPEQRAIGPYCGDSWLKVSGTTSPGISTSTATFPGNIYFRMRDKSTKQVSPIMNSYIGWKMHLRAVPLAAIVKHRDP